MAHVIFFDPENKQIDYMYMARNIETEKFVSGYIVVDKPWYSPESEWKYYIVNNSYKDGGFCGGAINDGFNKTLVDKNTIEIYNQTAIIKQNQENWDITQIIKRDCWGIEETIATIDVDDDIPYELWNK